jgi:hypothetical protein
MRKGGAPIKARLAAYRRQDGWRKRLEAVTDEWRREPFRWGTRDCARFAAACVGAVTGLDPVAALTSQNLVYGTPEEALKALKMLGCTRSLAELGDLLFDRVPPSLAQTGDLAQIVNDDAFGSALAVVLGERLLVVTENGLDSRERTEAIAAWAVGRAI